MSGESRIENVDLFLKCMLYALQKAANFDSQHLLRNLVNFVDFNYFLQILQVVRVVDASECLR